MQIYADKCIPPRVFKYGIYAGTLQAYFQFPLRVLSHKIDAFNSIATELLLNIGIMFVCVHDNEIGMNYPLHS